MVNSDKVLDKVRKLLALTRSNNVAEAASAASIANKLIDEYRFSSADLELKNEETSEPIEEAADYIYQSGRIVQWKVNLAKALAAHYGCAIWNDCDFSSGRKISRYKLVGHRSDVGICNYMYSWLTLECERLCRSEAHGMGKVFAASYCDGFVSGIATQLRASRSEVETQATGAAIVKINSRLKEAKEEMYRLHTNLRVVQTTSYSRRDGMAFSAGQQRGQSMHLGSSLGTGGTKLLK